MLQPKKSCVLIVLALICATYGQFVPIKQKPITQAPPKLNAKTLEKELFKLTNINDLSKYGIIFPPEMPAKQGIKEGGIKGRTGVIGDNKFQNLEEKRPKEATPGKCDPKPVCIPNPLTAGLTASNQVVFPPCINIHRCDGCCPENEKCVALKQDSVILSRVGILNVKEDSKVTFDEKTVTVKNDTECECRCQWDTDEDCQVINPNYVKDENYCGCVCPTFMDCNAYHEFDKDLCKCVCNKDKYSKLETTCKTRNLRWNESICRCESPR